MMSTPRTESILVRQLLGGSYVIEQRRPQMRGTDSVMSKCSAERKHSSQHTSLHIATKCHSYQRSLTPSRVFRPSGTRRRPAKELEHTRGRDLPSWGHRASANLDGWKTFLGLSTRLLGLTSRCLNLSTRQRRHFLSKPAPGSTRRPGGWPLSVGGSCCRRRPPNALCHDAPCHLSSSFHRWCFEDKRKNTRGLNCASRTDAAFENDGHRSRGQYSSPAVRVCRRGEAGRLPQRSVNGGRPPVRGLEVLVEVLALAHPARPAAVREVVDDFHRSPITDQELSLVGPTRAGGPVCVSFALRLREPRRPSARECATGAITQPLVGCARAFGAGA